MKKTIFLMLLLTSSFASADIGILERAEKDWSNEMWNCHSKCCFDDWCNSMCFDLCEYGNEIHREMKDFRSNKSLFGDGSYFCKVDAAIIDESGRISCFTKHCMCESPKYIYLETMCPVSCEGIFDDVKEIISPTEEGGE